MVEISEFNMIENHSETVFSLLQNCSDSKEDEPSDQIGDLLPTLLQIFLTIKLGWLAGFYKIIPPQDAKGLNIFVGKFSLPVLIFVSLATLNFDNVEWSFLLAIAISKVIIFVFVGIAEFIIHSPNDLSRASIFAIFCTQTNDFGMGLPILDAVYGHDHPYVGLLYLVAPISLLILNPIGFVLMEAEKNPSKENSGILQKLKTFLVVLRGLITNPIVFMTVLGILANLLFKGALPSYIANFLNALGAAFTSMAPFTLGLSMVGKLGNIRGENLKPIVALVVTKSILTPILTHIIVDQMSVMFTGSIDAALGNFGFLYGTFPTALGVDSYASQYNVNPDLISAAIVICTAFSAPLMYVAANILTVLDMDRDQFLVNLQNFQYNISMFSIIGVFLIAMIFIISKRYLKMPHSLSMSLLFLSLQTAVGGIIWSDGAVAGSLKQYISVIFHLHGIYACRLSTAILALALLLISYGKTKLVEKTKVLFVLFGPVMAGVGVTVLALTSPLSEDNGDDLLLAFGKNQDFVNIGVLSVSMLVTVACLILLQRSEQAKAEHSDTEAPTKSCPALTFATGAQCDKGEEEKSEPAPSASEYTPQMFRHTLLLMLLCCSMFSGAALSVSRIGNIWATEGAFPGVFKVLIFLDTFLASGQGLLFLFVFALDCKFILLPISQGLHYVLDKVKGNGNQMPSWISFKD